MKKDVLISILAVSLGVNGVLVYKIYQQNSKNPEKQENTNLDKMSNEEFKEIKTYVDGKIQNQYPTYAMLNADPQKYYNKIVTIYGTAKLINYYNYEYATTENMFYSIELRDFNYNMITIYFPRENNSKLFELLGKGGKFMKVTAIRKFNGHTGEYLAAGISWQLILDEYNSIKSK